jgi:hypothetical protein
VQAAFPGCPPVDPADIGPDYEILRPANGWEWVSVEGVVPATLDMSQTSLYSGHTQSADIVGVTLLRPSVGWPYERMWETGERRVVFHHDHRDAVIDAIAGSDRAFLATVRFEEDGVQFHSVVISWVADGASGELRAPGSCISAGPDDVNRFGASLDVRADELLVRILQAEEMYEEFVLFAETPISSYPEVGG